MERFPYLQLEKPCQKSTDAKFGSKPKCCFLISFLTISQNKNMLRAIFLFIINI